MYDIDLLMVMIPALPLLAAIITPILGPRLLKQHSHLPAVAAMTSSFVLSIALLTTVNSRVNQHDETVIAEEAAHGQHSDDPIPYEHIYTLWTWASVPGALDATTAPEVEGGSSPVPYNFDVSITLRSDPLTCIMLAMVTFVSSLVVVYSIGYMHGDPGYWRFFTYVSLFVFSMTMLVSVSNFALLYVFWEAVGVCSYLLIGFWYQKPEAAEAGKKAFLVNRVGDFGFALGVFLLWTTYGTLNFHDTFIPAAEGTQASETLVSGIFGESRLAAANGYVGGGVGLAICLLLLVGACGKSAQFPLHVWLPDAMEGPTPVSALIHAATMVTAGVYMIARCMPLYFASPEAQLVVAAVGCFTALLAALIALTQNDLKRVLAYSTVSQLGYLFLSLGTGTLAGVTAGMFHLFTHAFFKALLFLGAGSVMHAMGNVIDIRRFGGLRRLMPYTHWTFLVGCLALSGILPFAGFWSKDEILAAVHDAGHDHVWFEVFYWTAVVTAGMTAFYTFRAFFLTFYGKLEIPEEAGHHAHESPPSMTIPLVVLAVCATLVGWVFSYGHTFAHFLWSTPSLSYAPLFATLPEGGLQMHGEIAMLSTIVALSGIGVAAFLYFGDRWTLRVLTTILKPAYVLSYGKFFIDQIYELLIIVPVKALAVVAYSLDRLFVDGIVNTVGSIPKTFGRLFRHLQTGMIQFYALAMVLGLLVLVLVEAYLQWPPQ